MYLKESVIWIIYMQKFLYMYCMLYLMFTWICKSRDVIEFIG